MGLVFFASELDSEKQGLNMFYLTTSGIPSCQTRMMLVYLLAELRINLGEFKEAFRELLTHYNSSKPVISLPTLYHHPHTPGSTFASQQGSHGGRMVSPFLCGSSGCLPQSKDMKLRVGELAALKLTVNVKVSGCLPELSEQLVHLSAEGSWERCHPPSSNPTTLFRKKAADDGWMVVFIPTSGLL